MSNILVFIAFIIFLGVSSVSMGNPAKEFYRPHSHDYPKIIQGNDYETIHAIEALFADLKKIRKHPADCAAATILAFQANYSDPKTAAIFITLRRLLADYSKGQICRAVGFDQFSTRAYLRRTIIEFDFGKTVISVEAFSNGPSDGERLYVLDAVNRADSFFWESGQ